ncbi:MAG: oxidoreductase [Salinibacterium sp.]|nr:oxidoreductase [Salinibacterium sp.]
MKQWLDRMTGMVTMYTLVLVVLAAIGVNALVLSLIGQLSYGPLPLLASALVAILFTVASSWLGAKIMRVDAHLVSSFITALLVFFVLQPKIDLLGLSSFALAGLVAGLSKTLVAVRGRHIFNPAALGAIVPTLLVFTGLVPGMSFGAWWIGTPLLIPVTVIGAFLVLYRTQRLTLGLAFIVLAGAILTDLYVVRGAAFPDALSSALLSSPIIFFAGFMFSEPLTLPPRRWQQLAEALVVAVLFTIPLPLGPVSNSPLFALLVGNLLAFLVGQRRGIRLTYLGKEQIGAATWELTFQPARPVRFLPGQYMELGIPHRKADFRGSRRYFSIASAPNTERLTFAITVPAKSSSFKQALLDLEPGQLVHGTSVGGDFALPRNVSEPLLFVAGGIGITPFASQLAHATERGETRDVVVVYATSAGGPLPYSALLEKSGARVVLFGPEPPSTLPPGWEYAGEGRITGERLLAAVPDAARRRAFVSGPPALVNDLRRALRSQGTKRVHSDYFSGY